MSLCEPNYHHRFPDTLVCVCVCVCVCLRVSACVCVCETEIERAMDRAIISIDWPIAVTKRRRLE